MSHETFIKSVALIFIAGVIFYQVIPKYEYQWRRKERINLITGQVSILEWEEGRGHFWEYVPNK